jgi:hypothetical protein
MNTVHLQGAKCIEDLKLIVKEHVIDNRCQWYKRHRHIPWLLFRGIGIAIIVLSISIPFLVSKEGKLESWGAPIAALSVAILTSLNTFFAWQKSWEKRVRVWLTIDSFIAIWKTKIAEAKGKESAEDGFQVALEATQELINKTTRLEVEEAAALSAKFELKNTSSGKKRFSV